MGNNLSKNVRVETDSKVYLVPEEVWLAFLEENRNVIEEKNLRFPWRRREATPTPQLQPKQVSLARRNQTRITHFFLQDIKNPVPTYAFISTDSHTPKHTYELKNMTNNWAAWWKAEKNYSDERSAAGTPCEWKELKKWVVKKEKSTVFEQTIRSFLAILCAINNSEREKDELKRVRSFIKNQVFCAATNWSVVREMLSNCGMEFTLRGISQFGQQKESPLLKIADLQRNDGDMWNYLKFGVIGNLYGGKVKQMKQQPSLSSFISVYHAVDESGIPVFQKIDGTPGEIKLATEMGERILQMAIILAKMLGGKVDGVQVEVGFQKFENLSDWEPHHKEMLEALFGWITGRELEVEVPCEIVVDDINWGPAEDLL